MKKIVTFLLLILFVLGATSCSSKTTTVSLSDDRDEIKTVAIIELSKDYYEGDVTKLFDENKPISIIDDEQKDAFLQELLSLEFKKSFSLLPIPMDGGVDFSGYVVAIAYIDGGYDLIAEHGQFSADVDDNKTKYGYSHDDYCGELAWAYFINKYL